MVRDHGELAPTQLNGLLGVSLETIRRDLRIMEAQGLVRRSYGRVFPVESGAFETPLSVRSQVSPEEKMRIAAAAVEQIRDAQLIFVDEGYTPELIARNLP